MIKATTCLLTAVAALFCLIGPIHAEVSVLDDAVQKTPERQHCLPLQDIDSMKILDNQTILFHTYQNETWKNTLPAPCLGLKIEGGIRYAPKIGKICDLDIVTILRINTPCALGKFEKISP